MKLGVLVSLTRLALAAAGTITGVAVLIARANPERPATRVESPAPYQVLGGWLTHWAGGGAYTSFGFLGVFQRYVDRPTRVGRYLADTAFWVYLAHQELLMGPIGMLVKPMLLPWWGKALLSTARAMGAALVLFELFVRRTPLAYLFAPPKPRPSRPSDSGPLDLSSG